MAEMPDYDAIVKRLRANLDKYPEFVNLNAEAAAAIDALLAQRKVLVAEVEAARKLLALDEEWQSKQECPTSDCWFLNTGSSVADDQNYSAARAAVDAAFPGGLPK